MITIHLVGTAGAATTIKARPGQSLMQAAIDNNVAGIEADCGGLLTCGTCHVFVREPFLAQLPAQDPDESAMLDFTATPRRANSRLSCQITLSPALDGLTVDLPPAQH
ncbi:MAG: 2Fe-2S iron-sulfur cluster-binding protein [Pseudomonadota bacterium]